MNKVRFSYSHNFDIIGKFEVKNKPVYTLRDSILEDDNKLLMKIFNNLELLLNNKKIITSNSQYYFIPVKASKVLWLSICAKRDILYLGDLLELWSNDLLISNCSECGDNNNYIFTILGSPLSGRGYSKGYCAKCNKIVVEQSTSNRNFGEYYDFNLREVPYNLIPVKIDDLLSILIDN